MSKDLNEIAKIVDDAARTATAIPQLSETGHDLTLEEAYQVQALSLARRYARGEHQVGVKMGFTSEAKMKQMGLKEMIWGRLTNVMLVDNGGEIDLKHYVHPRVEPEICFRLRAPLAGEVSPEEALAAVDAVAPALEIIDSRYENFKFNLPDVVADNTSTSSYVVGDWYPADTDIADLAMAISFDGEEVQSGSTSAILGDPLRALIGAARLVGKDGGRLEAGWHVMAGGATAAEALTPGISVRLDTENMTPVTFNVK
ncbi:2-keto-4-pentenoate hydratase [Emcibacter nanhaiensis]|uniref:4-oxalocrotonate decarboxylase n=1 Tax=Emcibacter nanhaiensis TaxID=1505037 RepID=A0A501PFD3_9PROT|nr:fumarylacetoacetate hydrolase family protein [Emcibacter nanhaiensis]TPD58895.1 4-oxalocrotonate decarboxylase [Emcibacter nanhaiensis]TPD59908.1 4-oxalocrotonate decarboxylase [Emcibacter nanhaiensis]TPD60782.1 4-oxalocrotonate decarboxylase [Emcibacter nanhaiensis]TPD63237.1 4-oxalocrotonate decarboxylase [Emcibacter nanhaiensis]